RDVIQGVPVTDRHDKDRADVVEDCQGYEEQAQAVGNARTKEREPPDHERRIGSHYRSPAVGAGFSGEDRNVDGDGNYHAAERSCEGKRSRSQVSQFAHGELALHLQGDHEEEEGHQTVIDPVPRRTDEVQRAELQAYLHLPERQEPRRPGGICHDQCGYGGDQQQAPRSGLDLKEPREGPRYPVGERVRKARASGIDHLTLLRIAARRTVTFRPSGETAWLHTAMAG